MVDDEQYVQEEEWEREGLLDPAWEKQQRKVSSVKPNALDNQGQTIRQTDIVGQSYKGTQASIDMRSPADGLRLCPLVWSWNTYFGTKYGLQILFLCMENLIYNPQLLFLLQMSFCSVTSLIFFRHM